VAKENHRAIDMQLDRCNENGKEQNIYKANKEHMEESPTKAL